MKGSMSSQAQVAFLVSKIFPEVKDRTDRGFSNTKFVMLPSSPGIPAFFPKHMARFLANSSFHIDFNLKGDMAGFLAYEKPMEMQLESPKDDLEYWSRPELLALLQCEIQTAISNGMPKPTPETRTDLEIPSKRSFFDRFHSRSAGTESDLESGTLAKPTVVVEVKLREVHFVDMSVTGRRDTPCSTCIVISVEVK